MRIRPFNFDNDRDYTQYVAVHNEVWPKHYLTVEHLRFQDERLVPGFLFKRFVLEENGRIIGGAATGQSPGSFEPDRKSTRLNSSHSQQSRMPSSA